MTATVKELNGELHHRINRHDVYEAAEKKAMEDIEAQREQFSAAVADVLGEAAAAKKSAE